MRALNISLTILFLVAVMNLLTPGPMDMSLNTTRGDGSNTQVFVTQSKPPFTLFDPVFKEISIDRSTGKSAMFAVNGTLAQYSAASDQPLLSNLFQYMGYFVYGLKLVNFLINTVLMSTVYLPVLLNTMYISDGWCGSTGCYFVPWPLALLIGFFVNLLHVISVLEILGIKDVRAGA
jgi:hypothetical protein